MGLEAAAGVLGEVGEEEEVELPLARVGEELVQGRAGGYGARALVGEVAGFADIDGGRIG